MIVRVFWNLAEYAPAIADLPAAGPLPCRTVLVPRSSIAHSLRRELILAGRPDVLAGTRFALTPAAAVEVLRAAGVVFRTGEETLRASRLSALFPGLRLVHFSLDLLRSTPGWDQAFARTISDLEAAGLGPDDLDALRDSAQLRDVAAVWRALDESAGRSWTVQRTYREAAAVLGRSPDLSPFQGQVLAFATGELAAAEARFLRAIPEATVGLLAARPARQRYLDRIAHLLGAEAAARLRSTEAPRAAANERDLLASYLFEPPGVLGAPDRPRSTGPDGTVDLEEHAGVEGELEATADWVACQVVEGTPLEDIAVLVPDLDPLVGLVAGRLARLPWHDGSFPVHVAGGLPMAGFAAGARALAAIRALRAHLPVDALAEVLPALRLAGDADRRLSRRAAVDLLSALGSAGGNHARPAGALELTARAAERQTEFEERLMRAPVEGTAAPEVRRLERLVADLRAVRPALEALVGVARAALAGASISALWPLVHDFLADWLLQPGDGPRVHLVLDESLGDLAADAACGRLAGDDALRIVEEAILAARVPAGRFGEPAVTVGALRAAVGLRFAAVRVIGLAEGHLPALTREDPVIPDALRESLRDAGLPVATAADWALQNLHAFDAVVRNAERRVALSAPRLDVERSQREPSSVILEAAAALGRPDRATGERNAVIPDRIALERDAFTPARERAQRFRGDLPLDEAAWHDGVSRGVFAVPARWRAARALDLDRILREEGSNALDGLLGASVSDLPMPGLSPDRPISASAIQDLLGCPHAFLLGQVLGFDEPPALPPQREIGQPHYGHLFHTAAAEFYARHGASFCARDRDFSDWLVIADPIVDGVFQEFVKEYPTSGEAVRAQQRERLRRDVRELLEYDWRGPKVGRFVAVEKPFGQSIPVELHAGGRSLYVRGRIDRIDVEGERTLVRDLKTGRAHFRVGKEADPQPGVDVQIAVYGLVARLLADEWEIPKPIAAAYAYIGRGADERSFRQDFHEALEPAAGKWLGIATGLLAERLFPRTPDAGDCAYCPFRPVCGDGVYARAGALLSGAGDILGDFAALKNVRVEVEED
ncbi:MAG: PD-(D/E)XK nuclease family protein [Acidobacteria bacterium]|nr:MAG: PD-(D/E)XK nuclease family protein [Acidobacteriota bacterium]